MQRTAACGFLEGQPLCLLAPDKAGRAELSSASRAVGVRWVLCRITSVSVALGSLWRYILKKCIWQNSNYLSRTLTVNHTSSQGKEYLVLKNKCWGNTRKRVYQPLWGPSFISFFPAFLSYPTLLKKFRLFAHLKVNVPLTSIALAFSIFKV